MTEKWQVLIRFGSKTIKAMPTGQIGDRLPKFTQEDAEEMQVDPKEQTEDNPKEKEQTENNPTSSEPNDPKDVNAEKSNAEETQKHKEPQDLESLREETMSMIKDDSNQVEMYQQILNMYNEVSELQEKRCAHIEKTKESVR